MVTQVVELLLDLAAHGIGVERPSDRACCHVRIGEIALPEGNLETGEVPGLDERMVNQDGFLHGQQGEERDDEDRTNALQAGQQRNE